MKRAFFFLLVLVVLAGLAGGLGYFQFMFKPAMIRAIIAKSPQPVQTVAVAEVKQENWIPRLPAIGTFRAVAGIDIAPEVGGVVTAIHFESGQDVGKDDPLVNIDDSVEQADLKANIATLKNDDLALQRQLELAKTASTSKSTVDQAQATRDSAAAAVDRSRALIAQKSLVAAFSGRVGLRKIDVGQYVSPGTSIATLQQLDPIFVDFPTPEQNFGALRIGETVEVVVDAYPGQTFSGTVSSIDARVDANTRNVLVRAEVPNKERLLRPGMFANVDVLTGEPRQVLTLPRTAVTYSLYGDSVFVVKPAPAQPGEAQAAGAPQDQPQIVERRFVRTGDTRGDRVALTEGVAAGEKVVSEGQIKLQPNARVRVGNDGALPPPPMPRPKE
jgi:membrane fusion protein (multidrug efflux system)